MLVAIMEASKQEHHRSLVRNFLALNPDSRACDVADHFKKQGMARSTVFRYVRRIREDGTTKSRHSGGRKPCIMTETQ